MRPLDADTYRRISTLMYQHVGLKLNDAKLALVASRLAPRIQQLGLDGFDEYYWRIAGIEDDGELQVAIDLLTTNETYFFREPAHFRLLEQELRTRRSRSLALWSAASSFGDEAYSLAMLLADLHAQGVIGPNFSILGTDISDRVLRSARDAVYPDVRLREVTPERLRRYCLCGEGDSEGLVKIRPELTQHVRFGRLNLCEPIENLGPFDAIFLRNVLIYFDAPSKQQIVARVVRQLRQGGWLFTGHSESLSGVSADLRQERPSMYRRVPA